MTDQPNPAVPDETTTDLPTVEPPPASAASSASPAPEPPAAPLPGAETATFDTDADDGPIAPADAVSRDSGTFGSGVPAPRRSSGVRWEIPLGGVAMAVFVGWVVPSRLLASELTLRGWPLRGLRFTLRFVAPALVVAAAAASILG